MPTSPRPEASSWAVPAEAAVPEALQRDESSLGSLPSPREEAAPAGRVRILRTFDDEVETVDGPTTRPDDIVSTEYAAAAGMPARGVIWISAATGLGCAAVDVALTGGLTMFFDLCFVVICLVGAMAVRPRDLFTTGVLAPLVFGGVMAVVTAFEPQLLAATGGRGQAFLTGLADHAGALVAGYAVALLTVAGRVAARRQRSAG